MATKLSVYREALRLIREHDIASTTEDVEARYVLDAGYDATVQYCLSLGWWRFATTTVTQSATTNSTVPGYTHRFSIPADWLRTHSLNVLVGTVRYVPIDWKEQNGFIYVKYASPVFIYVRDDLTTESAWPEVFAKLVAGYLAYECAGRLSTSRTIQGDLAKEFENRLAIARASESMAPPLFLPDHAVERVTRNLLEQGFWKFSIIRVTPSSDTSPESGYTHCYTRPSNSLRIYQVYRVASASDRLYRLDWHEEDSKIHVNADAIRVDHVGGSFVDPSTWTEAFAQAVEAALVLEAARASGAPAEKTEEARIQLEHALDASLGKDRLPRPVVLPPHSVIRATRHLLETGFWRFSIKVTTPSTTAGPADGYVQAFTAPSDLLRVYDVATEVTGDKLRPVDWVHVGAKLSASLTSVRVRYVSSDYIDPATWPDSFAAVVDSYLALIAARAAGEPADKIEAARAQYEQLLAQSQDKDRLQPPMVLPEHAVQKTVRSLLEQGFWTFSMLRVTPSADTDPEAGYTSAFTRPSGTLRIYQLYRYVASGHGGGERLYRTDWHEEGGKLHANYSAVRVDHVAGSFTDPSTWPESFAQVVDAALALESLKASGFAKAEEIEAAKLQLDKLIDSVPSYERFPRPVRLRQHTIRSLVISMLEEAAWKFAIKTVELSDNAATASPGYDEAFDKPADWLRTIRVFRLVGNTEYDLDFRDEGDDLHANYDTINLRYISTDAIDPSSGWPEAFNQAFEAGVRWQEAIADKMPEDVVIARHREYRDLLKQAKIKDAMNERPRTTKEGSFNRGRLGFVSSREQGT